MSFYLLIKNRLWIQGALATAGVAFVTHGVAHPIPGFGIAVPLFVPVAGATIVALVLSRPNAPSLAYISGSLGTLIGADLLNLDTIQRLGAPVASIGGAGTFDGIFLTGIVAVLLASLFGHGDRLARRDTANVTEIAKAATIAYNDKNWDRVKELLAADAVYDEKSTERRIQGVGQILDAWKGWATAIPDSKATFVRELASGDTAVIEVVWTGVHTGPLQMPSGPIPASNKPIRVPACQVIQVEGEKVKSFTDYFDMLTLLTQIGAVKG